MNPRIELVYFAGCPNVEAARAVLLRAFAAAGVPARWREWDNKDARSPAYTRAYGSPTILIDGRDVTSQPQDNADTACCRVYSDGQGRLTPVPSLEMLVESLRRHWEPGPRKRHTGPRTGALRTAVGPLLPAVITAALPKLACPACWPAYAGLLSAAGIGFFDYTPYLLPATLLFLAIAVGALAVQAQRSARFGPLLLGTSAALVIVLGKFTLDSEIALYAGIVLLAGASLWRGLPPWAGLRGPSRECRCAPSSNHASEVARHD